MDLLWKAWGKLVDSDSRGSLGKVAVPRNTTLHSTRISTDVFIARRMICSLENVHPAWFDGEEVEDGETDIESTEETQTQTQTQTQIQTQIQDKRWDNVVEVIRKYNTLTVAPEAKWRGDHSIFMKFDQGGHLHLEWFPKHRRVTLEYYVEDDDDDEEEDETTTTTTTNRTMGFKKRTDREALLVVYEFMIQAFKKNPSHFNLNVPDAEDVYPSPYLQILHF